MARLRTAGQHKRLFALLASRGLLDGRAQLALQFSNWRTDKTSALFIEECEALIRALEGSQQRVSCNRMRRKMIHMAHLLGWKDEDGNCDMQRLDSWCIAYGVYHKPLMAHSYMELSALLSQFSLAFDSYLKAL